MTLFELQDYFNSFLKPENYSKDIAINGIQIQNSEPKTYEIKKIAFAVDACEVTIKTAAEDGCDVLFTHHGIFWGNSTAITGSHYKRVAPLIQFDMALISYHIPLDANIPYGNNFGIAKRLDLQNIEPFGNWRGMTIGLKGTLPKEMTTIQIARKILRPESTPIMVIDCAKNANRTVGIISGGAGADVDQAVAENLDVFITGSFEHESYHYTKESEINLIAGGHYETETVGVNLVMEKVKNELGIECVFIDTPTRL